MFEHSSVEWLFYVCEACILCLSPNILKFFWQSSTLKWWPHTISYDFLVMQAIITFFFVLNEMKNGGLHLDPTRFFHQLLTVLKYQIKLSNKQIKWSKWNQHLDLGFYLIEFHEFWSLSISAGCYQEIWKKGPHVGIT